MMRSFSKTHFEASSLVFSPPVPPAAAALEEEAISGSYPDDDRPLVDSGTPEREDSATQAPCERLFDRRGFIAATGVIAALLLTAGFWTASPPPPTAVKELLDVASPRMLQEQADVESTRTPWSTYFKQTVPRWHQLHASLAEEAAAFEPPAKGQWKVVLIGDSITESWRGTDFGWHRQRINGVPQVLRNTLAARWPSPTVLAIGGDQTQHVLWRLAHGELSPAMASAARVAFVLLIGTNNLGWRHSTSETHKGIVAVARTVLTRARGRLLISAILPREKSSSSIRPAIQSVNTMVQSSVADLSREFPARVGYVDCGEPFLDNRLEVKRDLMPDLLHPNAKGHNIFAGCLEVALLNLTR